jgi:hypothetical protein
MQRLLGWMVPAGLVLAITSAHAQVAAPNGDGRPLYTSVSDIGGAYAAMPPDAPGYDGPGYDGPRLLPSTEVYTVLRENGFSPLGIPRQRGFFYGIAVMDRRGNDGRLVIDGRDGRIVRFVPAYRTGYNYGGRGMQPDYGPGPGYVPAGPLPPMNSALRGAPRPPAPVPQLASRTPQVPLPKSGPPRSAEPPVAAAPKAAPPVQSMAMQAKPAVPSKPAEVSKAPETTTPAPIDAKPAPQIQPTEEMPKVQGLE